MYLVREGVFGVVPCLVHRERKGDRGEGGGPFFQVHGEGGGLEEECVN